MFNAGCGPRSILMPSVSPWAITNVKHLNPVTESYIVHVCAKFQPCRPNNETCVMKILMFEN